MVEFHDLEHGFARSVRFYRTGQSYLVVAGMFFQIRDAGDCRLHAGGLVGEDVSAGSVFIQTTGHGRRHTVALVLIISLNSLRKHQQREGGGSAPAPKGPDFLSCDFEKLFRY